MKRKRRIAPTPRLSPSEWARRRFRLDIALLAILVLVFYIIFSGNDSVLYQQGLIALIGAGVALIGQYIFGAAWDDKNYMDAISNMQDSDNSEYINTEIDESQIPTGEE